MKKYLPIYRLLVGVISLAFILFSFIENQTVMTALLLMLFVVELVYALTSIYKNIILLLFLIAFFTFLMGRLIIPLFINMNDYSFIFFSYMDFKPETNFHVIISLYLTLFFIFLSYVSCEINTHYKLKPGFDPQSPRIKFVRKWAKYFSWLSFPFVLLVVIEKIQYVLANGYSGMLLENESHLPSIVIILSVLFEYMVYLFLATLPSKKEAKNIIILYALFAITNIVGGDRGECMLALFVIIYYFFLRNRLNTGLKEWIGRKGILTMFLIAPLIAIALFSIAFLRDSKDMENNNNAVLLVGGFFFQQGASMNVIACAYEDENHLPKGKWYSIGPITDYFKTNYLSRLLFGSEPYSVGSQDLAIKGNSLDSAITYVESPSFYERGGGMGSSFIAEAYYDLGYIGIILYSLLYGFVLANIPKWNSKNIWLSVVAFVFLKYIMYAPRARATAFIASAASVSFWPIALIIFILSLQYPATQHAKTQQ